MVTSVKSAGEIAGWINQYGPSVVILSIFLIVFLSIMWLMIKSNKEYMRQLVDQNKTLITAILNNKNSSIHHSHDNALDMFLKLNSRLKNECKNTLDVIEANRTGIYTFHNGTTSISGFHFLKISCICEHFNKGCGTTSRMQEHSNIPAGLLDKTIERLTLHGNYIIYNNDNSIYDDANQIACKILLNNAKESCILYTIYGAENDPIGFILSEFDTDKVTLEELKDKRQYLRYLAEKVSPILEVSTYYKHKKEDIDSNEGGC